MNSTVEEYFVKNYIRPSRKDRLLYELTQSNKRYRGLSRFCHQSSSLLNISKIIMQGDDLPEQTEFLQFIQKHPDECDILSPDTTADGACLPLPKAVVLAEHCPDAIILVGKDFAIVYGEPGKSYREHYLLHI